MIRTIITTGDPAGIGLETTLKSLHYLYNSKKINLSDFIVIGDYKIFKKCFFFHKFSGSLFPEIIKPKNFNICIELLKKSHHLLSFILIDLNNVEQSNFKFGKISKFYAKASIEYIDYAVKLLKLKLAHSLVTAPVCKEATILSGIKEFKGHTEYLSKLTNSKNVAMLMIGDNKYRVLLLTRHIPLKEVSNKLSVNMILKQTLLVDNTLKIFFKIKSPKIFICNLNPHKGENGKIGTEEKNIIQQAVKKIKEKGFNVEGPILAEQAFTVKSDLIVCTYHDQAMLTLKLLCKKSIVNFTCGLPFIRTSPGHGTAFDIAGKNIADPSNMISAILLANKKSF